MLSFYGQSLEHLVSPDCPALYCLFTVIVAFVRCVQINDDEKFGGQVQNGLMICWPEGPKLEARKAESGERGSWEGAGSPCPPARVLGAL